MTLVTCLILIASCSIVAIIVYTVAKQQFQKQAVASDRMKDREVEAAKRKAQFQLNLLIIMVHTLVKELDNIQREVISISALLPVEVMSRLSAATARAYDLSVDANDFTLSERSQLGFLNKEFLLIDAIQLTCKVLSDELSSKGVNINLTVDESAPKKVHGDPNRVAQVLRGLMASAAVISSPGSTIEVEIGARTSEENVKVEGVVRLVATPTSKESFKINYAGAFNIHNITEDALSNSMESLFYVKLYVIRLIVEAMGGLVTMQRDKNKDTFFDFHFYLQKSKDCNPIKLKLKMLIVDDEPIIHYTIRAFLAEDHDIQVEIFTAENEAQALACLKSESVDCVLIDQNLEVTTGLDLVKKIAKLYKPENFILMSGTLSEELIKDGNNLGVSSFLKKPIVSSELLTVVKALSSKLP